MKEGKSGRKEGGKERMREGKRERRKEDASVTQEGREHRQKRNRVWWCGKEDYIKNRLKKM